MNVLIGNMRIKSETHPSGEDKDSTASPRTPLQTKYGTKNGRVGTSHDRKYRRGEKKIRVQLRSPKLSPTKSTNKVGEDGNVADPSNSTTNCVENHPEGKREEEN